MKKKTKPKLAEQEEPKKRGPVKYHSGKFPPEKALDWQRLVPLIGPASDAVARFDGLLTAMPNSHILMSPLMTHEAVLSSRIEGTQATMGEVMEFEAGSTKINDPEKEADIEEVLNYRLALNRASQLLSELPICSRLLCEVHSVLLSGVRGHDRARGKFRTIQNHIGSIGCTEEQARFVPISSENLAHGVRHWEIYLHSDSPDLLVQLAIVHAEFESLHPFLDGNGRLGRMLIPLFLFASKRLQSPTFYMSEYLETHRQEYYDRLLAVSRDDDWTGWCSFFLIGIREQARVNEQKARKILELYDHKKSLVTDAAHSHAIATLDFIFGTPIFRAKRFWEDTKIPKGSANRILSDLSENSLLRVLEKGSGKRSSLYVFSELLNIAEGRNIF